MLVVAILALRHAQCLIIDSHNTADYVMGVFTVQWLLKFRFPSVVHSYQCHEFKNFDDLINCFLAAVFDLANLIFSSHSFKNCVKLCLGSLDEIPICANIISLSCFY